MKVPDPKPTKLFADAVAKCEDCGATLKVRIDVQLHHCYISLVRRESVSDQRADACRRQAFSQWNIL